MWMLSFVPDSILQFVVYCMLAGGLGLYLAGLLATFIPPLRAYREAIRIAGTVLAVAGVYFFGAYSTEMAWRERVRELEEKVKVAEEKSQQVNTVIKEKIIYKTKVVEKKTVEYVDRIKEIAKEVDAKCEVDPRIVEELNKASENPTKETK
jgi:hypothetical protein